MKHNFKTNRLEGVPKEWAKKYRLPLEVDMEKTVDTRHLPPEIRPSGQLPKTLIDFIENKESVIRPSVLHLVIKEQNSRTTYQQTLIGSLSGQAGQIWN